MTGYVSKDEVIKIILTRVLENSDGISALNKVIYDLEQAEPADVIEVGNIKGLSICGSVDDLTLHKYEKNDFTDYVEFANSILYAPIMFGDKVAGHVTQIVGDKWFGVLYPQFLITSANMNCDIKVASIQLYKGDKFFWTSTGGKFA